MVVEVLKKIEREFYAQNMEQEESSYDGIGE